MQKLRALLAVVVGRPDSVHQPLGATFAPPHYGHFFASLMGGGASFAAHASSRQAILALVAAGHGITLPAAGQAEVSIPGVVFRPIAKENAMFPACVGA